MKKKKNMNCLSNKNNIGSGSAKRIWLLLLFIIVTAVTATAQNLNNPNKVGPLGTQVNTLSGNLYIPRTDIYIPARRFDLDVSFYYNMTHWLVELIKHRKDFSIHWHSISRVSMY